ncbi:ATP-dependent RNA helicase HrpB [Planctomycetes bacterium MalM25]|nr:ATP-dependent RNA helicase HrpB [Planctomycetes bacterium MalM25]
MSETPPPNPLADCWPADRPRLRRLKKSLRRRGSPAQRQARRARYDEALAESTRVYAARKANAPTVGFDGDLPVLAWREPIAQTIAENRVVVVCGETGSGKSTQLPKICLDAGRGVDGFIGHTQPRRLAARSVATRIADELGCDLGEHVGYKIRFQDETSPETYIKLMTDGVLLAEAQSDRDFDRYDTIIIDEAHERSLNIDLLLGLLRRVVDRRPDFRLIITSATIDAERFAEFFAIDGKPAPVIEVSGRSYPVEIRYRPADRAGEGEPANTPRQVADALDELLTERLSDTLVFLPTERDIRETARVLRGRFGDKQVEIVPLYARLSSKEQQRVFQRSKQRRVVLATNVAESSLTVPGIYSVIDTGTARVARFAAKSRVQRLPIEAISQASANQRAGRCGRIGPGVCVRLYSEDDYNTRSPYTVPEIRRTNLAGAMLRLLTLRLGDLEAMPLLDRPRPDALREAKRTLRELQAIDGAGEVTPLGERIGRMPVDPRVGRMILAGDDEGRLAEVLIIAAALETLDPRERPVDRQEAADNFHKRFADERSDFLGYLRMWDHLRQMRSDLSGSRFRKECVRQFLSVPKVLEWEDVHRQLLAMVRQQGLKLGPRGEDYAPIHRALLTGLLSGIALHRDEKGYQATSGEGFKLWPGSSLRGATPKWVMAAEVVETSARYLRTVARVRPEWLPQLADHLAKRHYRNVRWSLKQQTVLAQQKLTLFELPLPGSKIVPYGPINPAEAREVFLQEALVDEGLRGDWGFLEHNRQAVEAQRQLDAKLRRGASLDDGAELLDHYNEAIPADVCDARSLRRWLRQTGDAAGERLQLVVHEDEPATAERNADDFPTHLATSVGELPLQYAHAPGEQNDGVTLVVPAGLAPTLDPNRLDWATPGLLRDRVIGLIRLLPKPIRTRLVPAPDVADAVCEAIDFGEGSFLGTLAEALSRRAGVPIAASELPIDRLPDHLRINLRVEDESGACLIESRDYATVRSHLGPADEEAPRQRSRLIEDAQWDGPEVTEWSFDELPTAVSIQRGPHTLQAYPGLLDTGQAVRQALFTSQEDAAASTANGVRRLFSRRERKALREQVDWLPGVEDALADLARAEPRRDLMREVSELLAFRALADLPTPPRSREAFDALMHSASQRIAVATQESAKPIASLLKAWREAKQQVTQRGGPSEHLAVTEVREQIDELTPEGFLTATPWDRLLHLPRYLRAATLRLKRVAEGGGQQDQRMQAQVRPYLAQRDELLNSESRGVSAEAIDRFRWLIEEYRVSLFAQKLGTAEKVSPKKLDEQRARC